MSSRLRLFGPLAVLVLVVGACSSGATASPTTNAPAPTTAAATSAAPTSAAPSASAMASASAAVSIPPVPGGELITAGTLTICSDTSYPPQEFQDASNNSVGSDLDLAAEIGKRLGLKTVVKPTVFDTIIPALQGGSCDIIVSAQTITEQRKAQVTMIPYFEAGQSFVVLAGNPEKITTVDDLCGKAIAAEDGTVEAMHLSGTGDYKPADGLSQQCVAKGKKAISLKTFKKDTDALLALQAGTVAAHFTDEPVAGYEVKQGAGKFELVTGLTLERAPEGISVGKNHPGLAASITAALGAMIADGTYLQILTKWGVQSGALSGTAG